ncbi:hypothetical protein PO124_02305 [Bacillus licheniformis]|nr:hypothetical protein [Bacillus licheniformis]
MKRDRHPGQSQHHQHQQHQCSEIRISPLTTFHIDIKELCKTLLNCFWNKYFKKKSCKTLYIGAELVVRKAPIKKRGLLFTSRAFS